MLLPAVCFGLTWRAPAEAQQSNDPLRVVFLGDSITEAGAGPKGYVTLLQNEIQKRNADAKFEIIGAGVSGNKVPDLQARLEKDVLARKPHVVVIYIGINDVWHSQSGKGTPQDAFESGLYDVIGRIQKAGARVILCTPSVIGEKTDGSNPLDKMLETYAEISRNVAKKSAVTLIDLRKLFLNELKILNSDNKEKGILTGDGVHLTESGNTFVKDCMLPMVEGVAQGKKVDHVVMFKFKASTKVAEINRVSDAFAELAKNVPEVVEFRSGSDISPENLAQGFTHCYVLKFNNSAARDAYLVHPAHAEFVKLAIPFVETPLVVDFWEK
jgi:lysophospholipase L1-like esterase